MPQMQDMDGSNNWVVSGKLTASGFPIVSNDPHRTVSMPSLRYFVELDAPGWHVIGGGEPPFVGVDLGNNENIAWGVTFAGIDEWTPMSSRPIPDNPNETKLNGAWVPMKIIREEIKVKGEDNPRVVELKFSRHGPVFLRRPGAAYRVRRQVRGPGAGHRAVQRQSEAGTSDQLRGLFQRAMAWTVPSHNLICGDSKGNIALHVSGWAPDRNGFTGRLPVPGTGKYEWKGRRGIMPRIIIRQRLYRHRQRQHPGDNGLQGRAGLLQHHQGQDIARITRIQQDLDKQIAEGKKFTIEDMERIQQDNYSLHAERDAPLFKGWTAKDPTAEKARAMIAGWDISSQRTQCLARSMCAGPRWRPARKRWLPRPGRSSRRWSSRA